MESVERLQKYVGKIKGSRSCPSNPCFTVNNTIEIANYVADLKAQLAAAQEREAALNNDLYYALELVIAYAHSAADQEWASKRIDELKPPERELPAPPEQEATDDHK